MAKKIGVLGIILLFIVITTVNGLRPRSLNEGSLFIGRSQTQTRTLTQDEIDARFHAQGQALASANSHVNARDYARLEPQVQALAENIHVRTPPTSRANSHAQSQGHHTYAHACSSNI